MKTIIYDDVYILYMSEYGNCIPLKNFLISLIKQKNKIQRKNFNGE